MLKRFRPLRSFGYRIQPPLGGCVLKQSYSLTDNSLQEPAAFRRLCVETVRRSDSCSRSNPAAFRRLCVETVEAVERLPFEKPSRL